MREIFVRIDTREGLIRAGLSEEQADSLELPVLAQFTEFPTEERLRRAFDSIEKVAAFWAAQPNTRGLLSALLKAPVPPFRFPRVDEGCRKPQEGSGGEHE